MPLRTSELATANENLNERAMLAALSGEIGVALVKQETPNQMLQSCAEAIVRQLDVAASRIGN